MRVVHVDTGASWRGGQSQVMMLLTGLMNYDCRTLLVAKKGSALAGRAREEGLECMELPFCFEADLISSFSLAKIAAGEDTILHAHTPHALGHAITAARFGATSRLVFTRRVSFPVSSFFVNRWKFHQPSKIVAVSETVAGKLRDAGIPSQKIRVIYSAVDTGRFNYRGPQITAPFQVAVLGSIEKSKGIDQAMEFADMVSGLPVVFHFSGNGPDLDELERFAAARKNIVVHGFVDDVPQFLSQMTAAITFSPSEGFPNMVMQAMATGLPVMSYDNCAVREVIPDSRYGCVFRDLMTARDMLERFTSDPEAARAVGKEASDRVHSLFSHKRMVENTYQLYKEMVS